MAIGSKYSTPSLEERSDEFYGKICIDNDPDNISEYIKSDKPQATKIKISSCSADKLKSLLKELYLKICENSQYDLKRRSLAYMINDELTHRGIAPVWRGAPKFHNPKENSAQARYAADLQVFDLYWVFVHHSGLRAGDGEWNGIFDNIFTTPNFDQNKAYRIASSKLKGDTKIKSLRLSESIQEELAILRSDTVRKRVSRAKEESVNTQQSLIEAGHRNGRRKRTPEQIDKLLNVWLADKLSHSNSEALKKYAQITGQSINESTYRTSKKKIAETLASLKNKK